MTDGSKLIHITRAIDPLTRIHYLDALDNQGRHWVAQMSHNKEPWLVFTENWRLISERFHA